MRPSRGRRVERAPASMLSPMADAYIVDAVRSPDREAERLALGDPRGGARGAGPERPRRPARRRAGRDRGRPDGLRHPGRRAGAQRRAGRRCSSPGWPETVCASTVDRQCGSSLQAAFNGASAIQAGHLDLVVAAGVEHMTRVPMGSNLGDAGWGAVNEKIGERWPIVPQGISAEVLAEEWNLSRERARRVLARVPPSRGRRDRRGQVRERDRPRSRSDAAGAAVLFAVDETPRRDTSLEKLASLQPAFKPDGVVTAGNSSSIVDGSAAMLLASCKASENRARAARAVPVVRARGSRSPPDAPRQPASV